ncbi:hypothetical protein [Streptomyces novaecaesareae]|uniref:hypothetical protein n=1 Tax=Streptomyces novaecaesareae TaxID=68244 RepID=UPI000ADFDC76|nr:hypothetical protein [Streptomyces novaecaesareae]
MDLNEGPGTGRYGPGRGIAGRNDPERGSAGRIEVEIGELVLDGFEPIDHERLTTAFRTELTRLVRTRGVPLAAAGDRALDLLSGLPPLPAGSSPQRLGEALARAVHAGLSGGGQRVERGRT